MSELPKVNTVEALNALHGKPVPVAVFAFTTGKRKGIPWQAAVAAVVVLMAAALLVPLGAGKLFAKTIPADAFTPARTNAPLVTVTKAPEIAPVGATRPAAVAVQPVVPLDPNVVRTLWNTNGSRIQSGPQIMPEKPEAVKFYVKRAGFAIIGLHNGDTFTVAEGRLQVVGRLAIVDGNRVYRFPE